MFITKELYTNPLQSKGYSVGASVGLLFFDTSSSTIGRCRNAHAGKTYPILTLALSARLETIKFPGTCEGVAGVVGYNMPMSPSLQTPI